METSRKSSLFSRTCGIRSWGSLVEGCGKLLKLQADSTTKSSTPLPKSFETPFGKITGIPCRNDRAAPHRDSAGTPRRRQLKPLLVLRRTQGGYVEERQRSHSDRCLRYPQSNSWRLVEERNQGLTTLGSGHNLRLEFLGEFGNGQDIDLLLDTPA